VIAGITSQHDFLVRLPRLQPEWPIADHVFGVGPVVTVLSDDVAGDRVNRRQEMQEIAGWFCQLDA